MAFFGRTCKFVFSRAKIADDPFLVMSSLERTFALKYWGNVSMGRPSPQILGTPSPALPPKSSPCCCGIISTQLHDSAQEAEIVSDPLIMQEQQI